MDILAVGAHPDDIEIAAAATIQALTAAGHNITFLILTDDADIPEQRRAEARRSATRIGLAEGHLAFLGLPDAHLRADGDSVRLVRDWLATAGLRPTLVITHSLADSHNDHVAAANLCRAAFRSVVLLGFAVNGSSVVSEFAPRVFFEVTATRNAVKQQALEQYDSQKVRITQQRLPAYEAYMGNLSALGRAEAFDATIQHGADDTWRQVLALSESPFHKLWMSLTSGHPIHMYYSTANTNPSVRLEERDLESVGRDMLRNKFLDTWLPSSPLREFLSSTSRTPGSRTEQHLTLLVGNGEFNPMVRDSVNVRQDIRWKVLPNPNGMPAWALVDTQSGDVRRPQFDAHQRCSVDYLCLSVISNWNNSDGSLLAVSGCTPAGTQAGLALLSDPSLALDCLTAQTVTATSQVILRHDISADTQAALVRPETFTSENEIINPDR